MGVVKKKNRQQTCKKTPGPAKGGRKKTVYKGQPSIKGLPGHEERNLSLRLERQDSMQKDWQWRREVMRVVGAVSGWLELEQQLPTVSVLLSSVHTLSSSQ